MAADAVCQLLTGELAGHFTAPAAGWHSRSQGCSAAELMARLPGLPQVAKLAEAAQAWQRRAEKLQKQLHTSKEQQRGQLATASAQYSVQLQVRAPAFHH